MRTARCCVAWAVVWLSFIGRLQAQKPSQLLRLDEAKIRFHLLPQSELELPFINNSSRSLDGSYQLEMVDRIGSVRSAVKGTFHAEPGDTVETVRWDLNQLPDRSSSGLGWYRLRYAFTPNEAGDFWPRQGIVQLGPLIADAFELRITAATSVAFGGKYPVHLRVDHPASGRPYSQVPVDLELYVNGKREGSTQVTTDESGYATTVFDLPRGLSNVAGVLTATAHRGPFTEQHSINFNFAQRQTLTVTTDKPLYQPGQTVHLRLLAFGPDKQAWKGARFVVSIRDQEGIELFHSSVVASEFGVGTADWETPQKIRLGSYSIQATSEPGTNQRQVYAQCQVRLNRYDLPGFTVTATPDRSYYLSGQDASIEVRADYLFGKPLQRARVKVVHLGSRWWNFREQRWDTQEAEPVESNLDASGKATLKFTLKNHFPRESYDRYFVDLPMAAYVTDVSTGRTEQRRFTLRLSLEPIHLYLLQAGGLSSNEPLQVYVTSSYADGSPASVNGIVEAALPNAAGDFDVNPDSAHRRQLGKFHTNRYGVGRVELAPVTEDLLVIKSYYDQFQSVQWYGNYNRVRNTMVELPDTLPSVQRGAYFLLRASDAEGRNGTHREMIQIEPPEDFIRVDTDHSLYHPGEPLHIAIATNQNVNDMVVAISSEKGLLISELAHPQQGRVELKVPYDPRFRGELQIAAFGREAAQETGSGNGFLLENAVPRGVARVIYPASQELDIGLHLQKTTFRPGETATGDLRVRTPDGEPAESALGVVVFDRAVAERFRTDEDFGRGFGFSVFDYFDSLYQRDIAGVTYRGLLNLDASKPFPEGLDLTAEALLHTETYFPSWRYGVWSPWGTDVNSITSAPNYSVEAGSSFASSIYAIVEKIKEALNRIYKDRGVYPRTEDQFSAEVKEAGIGAGTLLDPWGLPYRPVFSVRGVFDVLTLVSNGVDKQPGTDDDINVRRFYWPYFAKVGTAIDQAVVDYHARTGKYVRDYPTLAAELKAKGIDLDSLRDPWGSSYSFEFAVAGPYFEIHVTSPGPDKRLDSSSKRSWDDVQEWISRTHYFLDETADLDQSLARHFAETGSFPRDNKELQTVLDLAKLTPERLLDPWGNPYYFEFPQQSRYGDRIQTRVYSAEGGQEKTTEVTPVTQSVAYIDVMSRGVPGSQMPFPVAEFSQVLSEQSSKEVTPVRTPKEPPRPQGNGGISGTVTDPSGAVIAGARVVAISAGTTENHATITDNSGLYSFRSLPVGTYRMEFTASGFELCVVLSVPVKQNGSTQVNASLRVGQSAETVEITAAAPIADTVSVSENMGVRAKVGRDSRSVGDVLLIDGQNKNEPLSAGTNAAKPLFTPRVRDYFPETMLWRPQIITDKNGEAHISFPMGDSITAWKMSVVASTESGEVGVTEKELRTFQPFFVEHDPPKALTQGDRISLPVVLRNYSDKALSVLAELKPEDWFTSLSAIRQNVTVEPNQDARAIFSFQAASSTHHGKQRVTARNTTTGDAVEREVVVHPDGEEVSFSIAKVLAAQNNSLQVQIPANALPGWNDAELRVYPNLIAHVLDAIHGIGARPVGCGEQITSVGYVNLMALQLLKKAGQDKAETGNPRTKVAADARRSVQEAYDQLAGAQIGDGGFGYWHVKSDVALTAYVVRFLVAASEFIAVNPDTLNRARKYLVAQQGKSGAWLRYDWENDANVEDVNLSAYATRALALALTAAKNSAVPAGSNKDKDGEEAEASLKRAFAFLEDQIGSWRDPYLVGNYALAAAAIGRKEYMARAQRLLDSQAHKEGPTTYWNLEANTSPFYGWGIGGRLETTALAVQALAALKEKTGAADTDEEVGRGLQYLLGHKDRYALWYSTQATQNVLEAMIAAMPPATGDQSAGTTASVVVNGHAVSTLQIPPGDTLAGPAVFELGPYLHKGVNQVELVREGGVAAMNTVALVSYYVPWSDSSATSTEGVQRGDTRALQLKVSFDQPETKVEDSVVCHVQTERIGFKGYGMLMAEIGLPPGVDVDRDSLEAARQEGIQGYEVQPDRVVFYVWPRAGGTEFTFRFKPRYRMEALTAPSVLYDYYNPEARTTIMPVRFNVR